MPYKPKRTPRGDARKRSTERAKARTRQQIRTPGKTQENAAGNIPASIGRLAAAVVKSVGKNSAKSASTTAKSTAKTKTVRTAPNSMTVVSPGKGGAVSKPSGREIATGVNKAKPGRVTYTKPPRTVRQAEADAANAARNKKVHSKARTYKKAVSGAAAGGGTAGFVAGQETQKKATDSKAMARKREEQRARNKAKVSRSKKK